MSEATYCPHCGEKSRKLNPHRMDLGKVTVLAQVGRLNELFTWVKVQRDGNLIPYTERDWTIQCDDVHALRCTWFGLLERKEMRSGLYRITGQGVEFLRGEYAVPAIIYCKNGVVVEATLEQVTIAEVKHVILDKAYWDGYASMQKPVAGEGWLF